MVHLSFKAFENMRSLRLLMVNPNVHFSTGPNFLPNKLRVLDWPNCPLQSLPSNFRGRDLIVLRMPRSPLKDLKGIKVQLLVLRKLCHDTLMLLPFYLFIFDIESLVSNLINFRILLRKFVNQGRN